MFLGELKKAYPDLPYNYELDNTVKEFESFYPGALKILQKDASFFEVERKAFGVNLSEIEHTEDFWKHLTLSTIASFFHGDIKTKFGTILNTAKTLWTGDNDEVSRILNDESSEGHLENLYTFIMDTRIAKIFLEIMEQIDVSSIDISNIENPGHLLEMIKNPEHPIIKKFIAKVQGLLKEKLTSGSYSQNQMVEEIEGIKAKVQSLFGNAVNDALGISGRRGDVSSAAFVSNSPEARRQRMIARLQRKQNEKTRR